MADSKDNMEQKQHFDALMQLLSPENPEPITSLDINQNLTDDQFAMFCETLKRNKFIKSLMVVRSNLSNKQLEVLGEALKRNTNINSLSFVGCEVESTEALIKFLNSLKENESIKKFALRNLKFGDYIKENINNTIFKRPRNFKLDENFSISRRAPHALVQVLPKILEYSHLDTFTFQSDDLVDFKEIFEKASAQSSPQPPAKSIVKALGTNAAPIKSLEVDEIRPGPGYVIRLRNTLDHILEQVNCDDMNQRPTELDLSGRTLNAEDLNKITAAFSFPINVRNRIKVLNLENATVDMDAFAKLLEALSLQPTIEELNLDILRFIQPNVSLGDFIDMTLYPTPQQAQQEILDTAALREAFKKLAANKVLRKLYLRNLDRAFLLNDGLASFFEVLTANQSRFEPDAKAEKEGSKLFHLDLTGLGSTEKPQFMAKTFEKLAAFCKTSPTLEVLVFGIISQFEAGPILQGLSDNPRSPLRRLEMCEELDRIALNYIVKILSRNTMHLLRLNTCNINAEGAKILAVALAQNESLEELYLSGNKIGSGPRNATDEGLDAIFKALSTNRNSSLQVLDLSNNSIECTRFGRIAADMLRSNQRLEQLILNENLLYDLRGLAEGLKANRSLKSLDMSSLTAPIIDVDLQELAEALKENEMHTENKTLQECFFSKRSELLMHPRNKTFDDTIQAGLQRNRAQNMMQFATALDLALDATSPLVKQLFQQISRPRPFLLAFGANTDDLRSKKNYLALSDAQAKAQKKKPPSGPARS